MAELEEEKRKWMVKIYTSMTKLPWQDEKLAIMELKKEKQERT